MYDFENGPDPDMDWYIGFLILLVILAMGVAIWGQRDRERLPLNEREKIELSE